MMVFMKISSIDSIFAAWDGSITEARRLQSDMAERIVLEDEPNLLSEPTLLAGFDVGFEDEGRTTRAAAVLMNAGDLRLLETHVVRVPTSMPYVPGLLSFRGVACTPASSDPIVTNSSTCICRWTWNRASTSARDRRAFWLSDQPTLYRRS